jgi:hypothetical protein
MLYGYLSVSRKAVRLPKSVVLVEEGEIENLRGCEGNSKLVVFGLTTTRVTSPAEDAARATPSRPTFAI